MADLSRADYLRKVRGLLAQAQDPATPPEMAETLTAKANELAAKFDFDVALAGAKDKGASDPIGDYVLPIRGSYAVDMWLMLNKIAKPIGVRTVRKSGHTRTMIDVHLFGPMSSIERLDMLFTSLMIQALRASAAEQPAHAKGAYLLNWRKDFLSGFGVKVGERLEEIEARARAAAESVATAAGTSTALVVANRAALTDRAVKAAYPNLSKSSFTRGKTSGRGAGQAAGMRADLGQKRAGGGSRTLTAG